MHHLALIKLFFNELKIDAIQSILRSESIHCLNIKMKKYDRIYKLLYVWTLKTI
jgi:hypothetical protein